MQPSPTPQPLPDLAVSVVLHFSPLEQLQALLDSLSKAAVEAQLSRVEVICVDHSCDADYVASCQAFIEAYGVQAVGDNGLQLSLLKPDANRGYGAGHNLAMSQIESQFHLILNPDVALAPDAFKLALDTLKRQPNIALLAPQGFSPSGEPEFLAKAYPCLGAGAAGFSTTLVKNPIGWGAGALRDARHAERDDVEADHPGLRLLHVGEACSF